MRLDGRRLKVMMEWERIKAVKDKAEQDWIDRHPDPKVGRAQFERALKCVARVDKHIFSDDRYRTFDPPQRSAIKRKLWHNFYVQEGPRLPRDLMDQLRQAAWLWFNARKGTR